MYCHCDWQGERLDYSVGKVVCVGGNYPQHVAEMGSQRSDEPTLFIKPKTSLCHLHQPIALSPLLGDVHHEVELAILIGTTLKQASEEHVSRSIAGYAIALDLTLRDLQQRLKRAGLPWERAKGFDNACPVSGFIAQEAFTGDPQNTMLTLVVNGEIRQHASTSDMIYPILPLISWMSHCFTLCSGDIVLTGTPQGVGSLQSGDKLLLRLGSHRVETRCL